MRQIKPTKGEEGEEKVVRQVTVLVCGGRGLNEFEVWNALERDFYLLLPFGNTFKKMIHGGASGADIGAARWAESEGVKVVEYKANWKKHGKAAGPIRNQQMLDEGKPDYVFAFPGGKGTADMVRRAEHAGITVIGIYP